MATVLVVHGAWTGGFAASLSRYTFDQPLELSDVSAGLPKAYIHCKRYAPGNVFRFSEQAQRAPHWIEPTCFAAIRFHFRTRWHAVFAPTPAVGRLRRQ